MPTDLTPGFLFEGIFLHALWFVSSRFSSLVAKFLAISVIIFEFSTDNFRKCGKKRLQSYAWWPDGPWVACVIMAAFLICWAFIGSNIGEKDCFIWEWYNIVIINWLKWLVSLNKKLFYFLPLTVLSCERTSLDVSVSFAVALSIFPVFISFLNHCASVSVFLLFTFVKRFRSAFTSLNCSSRSLSCLCLSRIAIVFWWGIIIFELCEVVSMERPLLRAFWNCFHCFLSGCSECCWGVSLKV